MSQYPFIAMVLAASAVSAFAAEPNKHPHGAHQHGVGKLTLVLEGKTITAEIENPAANVLGFEHAARTEAQKKAVQTATATLKSVDKIFGFAPEAKCDGQATKVEVEMEPDAHAEFHAEYRFICEKPDALKAVDVYVLKLFPGTSVLQTQIVTPRGQAAATLQHGATRLDLP
jgi:hypothetical protein